MLDILISYAPYLAVIMRVWLGANFVIHSRPKLKNGVATIATSMKLPIGTVYAATALELVGGIFLIVGLIVPIVALFFAIFMVANIIMKRARMHAEYIASGKPSIEIDVLYLMLSLVLLVLGAGVVSLDGIIGF
ncbi:MAG: DoxX family protein [Nitrososphaerales archaeon]